MISSITYRAQSHGRRFFLDLDPRQWWILLGGTFVLMVFWGVVNIVEDANASDAAYLRTQVFLERSLLLNHWNIPNLDLYVDSRTPLVRSHEIDPGVKQPTMTSMAKVNPVALLEQFEGRYAWSDGMRGRIVRVPSAPAAHQPDDWEKAILSLSPTSMKDVVSLQEVDSRPSMRVFRRLQIRQECLACHTTWAGPDIAVRTGISVVLPMSPFLKARDRRVLWIGFIVLGVWAVFALGFTFFALNYNKRRGEKELTELAREKIEAALKEREGQLQEMFDEAPVGYHELDSEGRLIRVNRTELGMLGYRSEEMIGQYVWTFVANQEASRRAVLGKLSGTTAPNRSAERELLRKDGTRIPVIVVDKILRNSAQEITGIRSTIQDATELRKMQGALRQNAESLGSIVEGTGIGLALSDQKGKFSTYNSALAQITGYSQSEANAFEDFSSVIFSDKKEGHHVFIADVAGLAGSAMEDTETEIVAKDGTTKTIFLSRRVLEIEYVKKMLSSWRDITARKKAENLLLEQQQTLAAITSSANDAIVMMNDGGRISFWNRAAENILGWTEREAIGRDFRDLNAPDLLLHKYRDSLATFTDSGMTGPIGTKELRTKRKDGTEIDIALSSSTVALQGKWYVVAIIRDITAQRKADESLREQQQTIQAITSSANDAIVMMDAQGRVSFWNFAAEKILGWSENEALGRDLADLIVPQRYRQDHRTGVAGFESHGRGAAIGKTVEMQAMRKDATEIEISLSLSAVELRGKWHAIGIIRDITETKRTELVRLVLYDIAHAATSLESLEEFYDAIRVNVGKLMSVKNFYIAVYDDTTDMLSFPYFRDENDPVPEPRHLGKGLTDLVIRSGRSLMADAPACKELRTNGQIEFVGSPSEIWMGVPLKIGEVVSGVIVVQSYSDPHCYTTKDLEILEYVASQLTLAINRRHAEQKIRSQVALIEESNEALAHARDQAVEASKAKGSFLANMSHELRTPLNAIIGYSEILLEEMSPAEKVAFSGDIGKIYTAGHHLLDLINDILDISKIEAGRMELFVEEFSLSQLLEEVEATIRPSIATKTNHLTISAPELPVLVHLDRTKVRQILLNLLSNACKFTEKGEITLTVRIDSTRTLQPVEVIVFDVKDTGIGMSPEQTKLLFRDFSQADSSTTRKYGGTGLGLAISRRFCEMMHGTIDLQSVPQEGSVFTVTLPVSLLASDTPIEPGPHAKAKQDILQSAQGPTVLIIDDDADVRDLLSRVIRKDGFSVVTAHNGADGVALARKIRPTVVILDAVMPQRDGWTVLREMKDDPDLRSIPVIMHTIIDNKNLGFALGARDYLVKPVDHETLTRALRRYKETSRPTQVLIVEDDQRQRESLSKMLSKEGCHVSAVGGGSEALAFLSRSLPDIIFLDLMMAPMDGFEFLRRVKEHGSWTDIPILILSAMDLDKKEVELLSSSVVSVLRKDRFDPQHVLALVRRYGRTSGTAPVK